MLKQKIVPTYQRPSRGNHLVAAQANQYRRKSWLYRLCSNFYLSQLRSAVAKKSTSARPQSRALNECCPRFYSEPQADPLGFLSLLS